MSINDDIDRTRRYLDELVAAMLTEQGKGDPLETVKRLAERITGCECETSYSEDKQTINIRVKPPLDQIYMTIERRRVA